MQIVKEHGVHLVTYVNGKRVFVYVGIFVCVCVSPLSGSFASAAAGGG